MTDFTSELRTLVRARRPIIWVETHEEERVLAAAYAVARDPVPGGNKAAKNLYLWSYSNGPRVVESLDMQGRTTPHPGAVEPDAPEGSPANPDPVLALKLAMSYDPAKADPNGAIWVFRDLHRFIRPEDAPVVYRFLRDAVEMLRRTETTIIISSPVSHNLPIELEKVITVLPMNLPNADELGRLMDDIVASTNKTYGSGAVPLPINGEREAAIKAGMGLTETEFGFAVKESIIRHRRVDPRSLLGAKEQVIKKSGVMELYQHEETLDSVGGHDNLKSWVLSRGASYTEKAQKYGLEYAKGALLIGPPGTGKTLVAKATANSLGVPLLLVRADSIFSKYVGESEQNVRKITQVADTVAPCIVFIDEVEKMLAGSGGSGDNDSGVTKRILGTLLTWMNDHTTPVLVMATCNDPTGLRDEFLQRFDQTFFVDLPSKKDREDIFKIHLKKRKRDPSKFDLKRLSDSTEGFSGREIERVIKESLYIPFSQNREVTTDDIFSVARGTRPLSVTRKGSVEKMREWARANATASADVSKQTEVPQQASEVAL